MSARRWAAGAAGAVLLLAGCVDHDANAQTFCDRHLPLVAASGDNAEPSQDQVRDIEKSIEKSMRHAEDATKPVRLAARDLLAAYGDFRDVRGDDDADPDELSEARQDLRVARADLRAACADFAPTVGAN